MPSPSAAVHQAADQILATWREPGASSLDPELRPINLAQAYGIQQAVSRQLGVIGGWRICRPGPETGCACAPLPIASIRPSPARVVLGGERQAQLEAQLCFRIGRNLPEYDAPYTREEVLDAVESCHPGVAVLHSQDSGDDPADALTAIAQSCGYRYLVYGRALPAWPAIGLDCARISVMQDGQRVFSEAVAAAEDAIELLQWLVNEGAHWGEGLAVRQWVAIGLTSAEIRVSTDRPARIVVGSLGPIDLRFV